MYFLDDTIRFWIPKTISARFLEKYLGEFYPHLGNKHVIQRTRGKKRRSTQTPCIFKAPVEGISICHVSFLMYPVPIINLAIVFLLPIEYKDVKFCSKYVYRSAGDDKHHKRVKYCVKYHCKKVKLYKEGECRNWKLRSGRSSVFGMMPISSFLFHAP